MSMPQFLPSKPDKAFTFHEALHQALVSDSIIQILLSKLGSKLKEHGAGKIGMPIVKVRICVNYYSPGAQSSYQQAKITSFSKLRDYAGNDTEKNHVEDIRNLNDEFFDRQWKAITDLIDQLRNGEFTATGTKEPPSHALAQIDLPVEWWSRSAWFNIGRGDLYDQIDGKEHLVFSSIRLRANNEFHQQVERADNLPKQNPCRTSIRGDTETNSGSQAPTQDSMKRGSGRKSKTIAEIMTEDFFKPELELWMNDDSQKIKRPSQINGRKFAKYLRNNHSSLQEYAFRTVYGQTLQLLNGADKKWLEASLK